MDYLYINAIVKEVYKDLPCGCPFPAEFGKSMYATVSGMDCISNPEVPEVLSFFTLRAKGQASAIVFSKIQKHTNSASVGRFIQSVGWTWNGDLLFRNLDEIMNTGFFSEEEINATALRGGSFALPKNLRSRYEEIPLTLSAKVKEAILTTVLLRWLRFDAPLRIAVPDNVDYNSYVISAMKKIYSLFPATLRAKAGFCSYLPSDKNVPETISIGFVPEKMADSRTLCLDGSSAAACAKLNCGTDSTPMDTFIQYIAHAPEDDLPGFFEEIYEDLEGSGSNEKMILVIPRDYQAIGMALNLLTLEGSLSEQLSQWNRNFFGYKERDKIPARWQLRIREKIRQTIDPAEFCRLVEKRLSTEGFEGLKVYQNYCEGNPKLSAALWDTTVALQISRNKTYTDIYNHVLRRKTDLAFVMDDAKLDRLFCQSVNEQLQTLQLRPAQNLKEVRALTTDVLELKKFAETREASDKAGLRKSLQDFLKQLKDRENALLLEKMTEGFRQRQGTPHQDNIEKIQLLTEELTDYRKKVAERSEVPGVDQLLAEMDAFVDGLRDRKADLIHEDFLQQYRKIANKPVKTVDQIEKVIEEAKALLEKVVAAAPIEKNLRLQNTIGRFVQEMEAQINSSNVKFQEIDKILRNPAWDYFQILEELNKADKTQLEDQHRLIIQERLMRLRPVSLTAYEQGFRGYYGKPMVLASIAARPDYVVGILVRDICQLSKIALSCSSGKSPVENAERIAGALAIAEKISAGSTVAVTYDGTAVSDPAWFRKLLLLSHTAATAGDKAHLERVLRKLVESNTFSGDEMVPALAMLSRCDMEPSMLFVYILRGDFRGATEQQYRQAYELLLQSSVESLKVTLDAMHKDVENRKANADGAALKAFHRFLRDHTPKDSGKGNKLMIAIICILAVIITALTAAVVILIQKGKAPEPQPTTAATTVATLPPETEPVLVYPEEAAFYQRDRDGFRTLYGNGTVADFSVHSQKVAALLDAVDEQTAALILDAYSDHHGTMVTIDDKGTAVSWDEYFFWLCWNYADQEIVELQKNLIGNDEKVLPILRVLHGESDKPAEPVVDTVPETTEPTTAQTAETVPTQPAEATDTQPAEQLTQEPAAETEPVASVTVADVKIVIIESARHCYEANRAQAERALQLQELFGEDFRLDFGYHSGMVEGFALTGEEGTVNEHILNHYNTLPGEYVIRIEEMDLEVTWNEFVFWECWVLAKDGAAVDENSFSEDLRKEVVEILFLIHQLVNTEEYSAARDAALALAAKMPAEVEVETTEPVTTEAVNADPAETTAETTMPAPVETEPAEMEPSEPTVLQIMVEQARTAFENARETYGIIFKQVKAS